MQGYDEPPFSCFNIRCFNIHFRIHGYLTSLEGGNTGNKHLFRPLLPYYNRLDGGRLTYFINKLNRNTHTSMNKSELAAVIARKLDRPVNETHLFVNTMLESIAEALATNEEISLHNFGKLIPKQRKERLVRNPKNGATCMLEPILSVKFRPGKGLIDFINPK